MANKNSNSTTTGAKRGRKRTTANVNKKILSKAITAVAKHRRCGAVAFAQENNLNVQELIARLRAEGVEIRKGRPRSNPAPLAAVSA